MKTLIQNDGEKRFYREWLHIKLVHEYYGDNPIPILLAPDLETIDWINRKGILLRHPQVDHCSLLTLDDVDLTEKEVSLVFEIRSSDERFYHVSQSCEEDNDSFSITTSERYAVWRRIVLNPLHLAKKRSIYLTVHAYSQEKYIEYLCIPKYNSPELNLRMSDANGYLNLINPPERIALPGIPVAWRFVTKEKVKLIQNKEVRAQLWEIREQGERSIGNSIPFPRPEQLSPLSPGDTLTSIFYY